MNWCSCAMLTWKKVVPIFLHQKWIGLAVMGKYHSELLMLFNLAFLMKCKYILFNVPPKSIAFTWRCNHSRWRTAWCWTLLAAYGLWAVRVVLLWHTCYNTGPWFFVVSIKACKGMSPSVTIKDNKDELFERGSPRVHVYRLMKTAVQFGLF